MRIVGVHSCSCFWLNFQATIKFVTVSVRLFLSKVGADQFTRFTTGNWRQIEKILFISDQGYKGRIRDYRSLFWAIFQTTNKFPIVIFRSIFGKVGVDGVTRPWRETNIRYESDLKIFLKFYEWKQRFLPPFLVEFPSNQICRFFCKADISKSCGWRVYQATTGKWRQI